MYIILYVSKHYIQNKVTRLLNYMCYASEHM